MRVGIAFLAGCSFTPPASGEPGDPAVPPDAAVIAVDAPDALLPPDPPEPFALRVAADIDGRSRLVIRDRTVRWIHFQFAAPGREAGDNIPTTLGEVAWFPEWPDTPTAENRDCNGCQSNAYLELPVALPRVPSTVTLARITGNRDATVIEAPVASNDFTLIVELSDVGFGGSSIYTIDIDVTPL
jgi:hypothetical protein